MANMMFTGNGYHNRVRLNRAWWNGLAVLIGDVVVSDMLRGGAEFLVSPEVDTLKANRALRYGVTVINYAQYIVRATQVAHYFDSVQADRIRTYLTVYPPSHPTSVPGAVLPRPVSAIELRMDRGVEVPVEPTPPRRRGRIIDFGD